MPRVDLVPLGRSGVLVGRLGLGCLGLSGAYGRADQIESTLAIQRALELGADLLDTGEAYGAGHNEELVGRAIVGRRARALLATKFDGEPAAVARRCDASLRRLRVDVIDLYYLQRFDAGVPVEETVGAMGRLVEAGKVRFLGLCNPSAPELQKAAAAHPIAAVQVEYSLWRREPERLLLPACRALGAAIVACSPLARGLFGAPFRSFDDLAPDDSRRADPRFSGAAFERNLALARKLELVAAGMGKTAAQVALAWLLAHGLDVVPIPGSRRRHRVEENCAAADLKLTADALARIEAAVPRGSDALERPAPA